jgi:S1-C subfamily serine protease
MAKALTTPMLALTLLVSCHAADFSEYTYHLRVVKIGFVEHGTAVAVQAEGFGHFILTANHCVKDSETAELSNKDTTVTAKVVFRDAEMDFAILKADVPKYAALANSDLKIGMALTFCHYPRGKGPKTTSGSVVSIKDGNINYFAHADEFYHGSSGCPVFSRKDVVVGIALAGMGVNGVMVEGEALFLPSKRIFQSIKAYIDAKALLAVKAVVIDLDEKF